MTPSKKKTITIALALADDRLLSRAARAGSIHQQQHGVRIAEAVVERGEGPCDEILDIDGGVDVFGQRHATARVPAVPI
jgi:hypothetical protein